MWLSSFIAITNSNGACASLWIFNIVKLFHQLDSPGFHGVFEKLYDVTECIVHFEIVCYPSLQDDIICLFFSSIHAIACLVLFFLRVCWSMYSSTPVPSFHLWYLFCSSDNSPRLCCILAFDPAKNAIQSDAPEGSDTFQWQLWEEIAQVSSTDNLGQGEGPTSEWCTGREWPVNCMTVISARWRSHMPFQRSSGRWTII